MILVGCDLHTRKQQVALLNTDTGELWEQELSHVGADVEQVLRRVAVPRHRGHREHRLLVVVPRAPAAPGAYAPRRRGREDPGDGRAQDQDRSPRRSTPPGPSEGRPLPPRLDSRSDDARFARAHQTSAPPRPHPYDGQERPARDRSESAAGPGPFVWSRQGLAQLQALVLLPHTRRRRDDSLDLLQWLNRHIDELDLQVATAAAADPNARRLMTHPGVGPLTVLATVLVLGPVARFPGSKHVVSYIGLAPGCQRVRGQVPAGAHQQAGQRAPALGARPGGSARDPRRCGAQSASTLPSSDGAAGPKRRWPWPGASSSGSTSCCAIRSTTTSSAAAAEPDTVASSWRALRCSRGRDRRDEPGGLTATVPVRAFSG